MSELAWQWLGMAGMAGVAAQGVHMVRRPDAYRGARTRDARSPRTVRQFGILQIAVAATVFALILIKLVQG